jgi:ABC-2 type transport system ATP-binding protein
MIAIEELTKVYGARPALDRVTFEVPEREIFGFVGPNGAGKTTTLRILAGLLQPTAGRAFIGGADVTKEREKVHNRIGYMPDFFGVYDQLTVGEYLDFYAACYRQPRARRRKIVDDLLALVGMTERKSTIRRCSCSTSLRRVSIPAPGSRCARSSKSFRRWARRSSSRATYFPSSPTCAR